jgi:hypothetical protein
MAAVPTLMPVLKADRSCVATEGRRPLGTGALPSRKKHLPAQGRQARRPAGRARVGRLYSGAARNRNMGARCGPTQWNCPGVAVLIDGIAVRRPHGAWSYDCGYRAFPCPTQRLWMGVSGRLLGRHLETFPNECLVRGRTHRRCVLMWRLPCRYEAIAKRERVLTWSRRTRSRPRRSTGSSPPPPALRTCQGNTRHSGRASCRPLLRACALARHHGRTG